MGMKENFYANFPKAQKGTNYMDLDFLDRKEKAVALNAVVHFYRKIKNPESRYAEFSHVISRACQHIKVKVMDDRDVQTFLTLATTLNNAVNAGTVIDKKKKFTNLETVIAKIKEAATTYFGHEF